MLLLAVALAVDVEVAALRGVEVAAVEVAALLGVEAAAVLVVDVVAPAIIGPVRCCGLC
jgi:hypothetical protein